MLANVSHDKVEKILGLLSEVAVAVVKAKEDGDLDLEDIKHFLPLVGSVGPAIQALAGVGEEIKLLTVTDWMEVISSVIKKLGPIVSPKLEAIVKQSLVCAIEAAKLISVIKG